MSDKLSVSMRESFEILKSTQPAACLVPPLSEEQYNFIAPTGKNQLQIPTTLVVRAGCAQVFLGRAPARVSLGRGFR